MRSIVFLVFFALIFAFIFDLSGVTTKSDVQWTIFDPTVSGSNNPEIDSTDFKEVDFPVTLNQHKPLAVVGLFKTKGYKVTGWLDITISGEKVAFSHNDKIINLSPHKDICTTLSGDTFRCRAVIHTQSDSVDFVRLYSVSSENVSIVDVSYTEARMKRSSILSGNIIYVYFVSLAFLGPIFFLLRRKKDAELYCLIIITSVFCVFLSLESFIFIICFLLCSYCFIVQLGRESQNKRNVLFCLILFAIFVLVAVKVALPHVGYLFANPGRFWFVLPLGFSYYIIRLIDLALNVYSGAISNVRLLDFLAFMLFPPTLPAGPIFTFDKFITARLVQYNVVDYGSGLARIFYGIIKKIFADTWIYPFVLSQTNLFIVNPDGMSSGSVLKFLLANTLFVYLDFSAYSDMAIGAGRAMGWNVPENFNFPLLQTRLRNFWQSWHMTLSNWVMRRVYMSTIMSCRSIWLSTFASMLTIGLWHTINLSWSFWALHHTLIMTLERSVVSKLSSIRRFVSQKQWAVFGEEVFKSIFGVCLVWFWVALGHSFTLFSNIELAFDAYFSALLTPFVLFLSLFGR